MGDGEEGQMYKSALGDPITFSSTFDAIENRVLKYMPRFNYWDSCNDVRDNNIYNMPDTDQRVLV